MLQKCHLIQINLQKITLILKFYFIKNWPNVKKLVLKKILLKKLSFDTNNIII